MERNGTLDGITPESKGQHHNFGRVYLLPEFTGHFCKGVFLWVGWFVWLVLGGMFGFFNKQCLFFRNYMFLMYQNQFAKNQQVVL